MSLTTAANSTSPQSESDHPVKIVTDASFLLQGEYSQVGFDLVITNASGDTFVVEDYFSQQPPPNLMLANGAGLSPEMVKQLLHQPFGDLMIAGPATETSADIEIGTVRFILGRVTATNTDGEERVLRRGDSLYKGDEVRTDGRGFVRAQMLDGTRFNLGKNARATLDDFEFNEAEQVGLFEATVFVGGFHYRSGLIGTLNPTARHSTIKTPSAIIGIRGSELSGNVAADGETTIRHDAGILDISDINGDNTVTLLEPGNISVILFNGTPDFSTAPSQAQIQLLQESLPPPETAAEAAIEQLEDDEPQEEQDEETTEESQGTEAEEEVVALEGEAEEEGAETEEETEEGGEETEPEAEEEVDPDAEADDVDAGAEAEAQAQAEAQAELDAQADAQAQSAEDAQAQADADAQAEADTQAQLELDAQAEVEAQAQAEAQEQAQLEADTPTDEPLVDEGVAAQITPDGAPEVAAALDEGAGETAPEADDVAAVSPESEQDPFTIAEMADADDPFGDADARAQLDPAAMSIDEFAQDLGDPSGQESDADRIGGAEEELLIGNNSPQPALPISDQIAVVNSPYGLSLPSKAFTDPDGDFLRFSASGVPSGLFFDAETETILGAPTEDAVGIHTVTVTATDPFGAVSTSQFTLNVLGSSADAEGNIPPVLAAPIFNQTALIDQPFRICN